jgi:4,5-dihydroxyphthalate decarboxylase
MPKFCIHIPNCIWTKALLDGSVKVDGVDVEFEPAVFDQRGSRRLRGEVEEKYVGTEQVIPDYLVRIARGVEKDLIALPIFVTRGMVQRKFVMRRDSLSPRDLTGRVIGMGRVLGATSVYVRGLLVNHFGVARSDVRWVTAEPLTSDEAMGGEWSHTYKRVGIKASELIEHLSLGKLDAVIYPGGAGGHWFNWIVENGAASRTPDPYGDLEQMVSASSNLCFPCGDVDAHAAWFKEEGIYPTYHFLAIRKSFATSHIGVAAALVDAFERASMRAPIYMNAGECKLYEREKKILGVDPNECGLSKLHKQTLERCLDYLAADGVLPRRPAINEIFAVS